MELLVIRHGIAADRESFAGDDEARPLTEPGRRRMRDVARGLRRMVSALDLVCTSPLVRARQTADIVSAAFGDAPVVEWATLAPAAGPEAVARSLGDQQAGAVLALVGHEPDLSDLCTWLCAGVSRPILDLKKGAACLLALDEGVGPGRARLRWALPPRAARRLRG